MGREGVVDVSSKAVVRHICESLMPLGTLKQHTPGNVTVLIFNQIIGKTGVNSPLMKPTTDCQVPCNRIKYSWNSCSSSVNGSVISRQTLLQHAVRCDYSLYVSDLYVLKRPISLCSGRKCKCTHPEHLYLGKEHAINAYYRAVLKR